MVDSTLHTLSAIFAIIAGTGAGVLSILAWRILRRSPFGTVVALLSVTMSGTIVYHVVLFVLQPDSLFPSAFRSALHTVLVIFVWLAIATHRRLQQNASGG